MCLYNFFFLFCSRTCCIRAGIGRLSLKSQIIKILGFVGCPWSLLQLFNSATVVWKQWSIIHKWFVLIKFYLWAPEFHFYIIVIKYYSDFLQPFKNVKMILSSQAIQKQAVAGFGLSHRLLTLILEQQHIFFFPKRLSVMVLCNWINKINIILQIKFLTPGAGSFIYFIYFFKKPQVFEKYVSWNF